MSLLLINRSPEPDESNWPIDGLIEFDVINTVAGDAPDPASLRVYVDGVLVLSGSSFQVGWDGPGSALTAVAADTLRVAVDPTSNFLSLQSLMVHVTVNAAANPTLLDQSYSFTVEDVSNPELAGVRALALDSVEVTFNEEVSAEALEPGSYTLTRLVAPSVNAKVVSVTRNTSKVFTLTTDIALTHDVSYMLGVSQVRDLSGNTISPPFDELAFQSFMPAVPEGRDFQLYQMLPQMNRDEDTTEDLKKFVACLQEVTDQLLFSIDAWSDIIDVDTAPEAFVDAMLNDLGNPFNFALSLVDKRRLARVLVPIYKQKGLAKGIKNAVRFFLGFEVAISPFTDDGLSLGDSELGVDWELGTGDRRALRTFNLEVTFMLTDEQRQRLLKIARYMKPLNTHIGLLIEPTVPETFDHWELGFSGLGDTTILH